MDRIPKYVVSLSLSPNCLIAGLQQLGGKLGREFVDVICGASMVPSLDPSSIFGSPKGRVVEALPASGRRLEETSLILGKLF